MLDQHSDHGQALGPLEPFAAWLRQARRKARVRVRLRLGGWAPVFGYVYIGVALTYLIDTSVTLGAVGLVLGVPVTWVCGLWVVPRSEDAYVLAVSAALSEWVADAVGIRARRASANREYASAILASLPSWLSYDLRENLSAALEREGETPEPTRDVVYVRVMLAHELFVLLKSTLAQLENNAEDDHAAELRAAIAGHIDASRTAQREFLRALRREQVCLAKISSPAALRARHDLYLQLVGEYGDAVAAWGDASESEQAEVVQQAAEEICNLWQATDDFRRTMAHKLQECYGNQQ
jgi:hypothetical protein